MSTETLRNILGLLGCAVGVIGFFFVLGACGGLEGGEDFSAVQWFFLAGLGLMVVGVLAVNYAIK